MRVGDLREFSGGGRRLTPCGGCLARDAANGVYHGREDIVFGAPSGAIAIRALDPRIPLATVLRARAVAGAG